MPRVCVDWDGTLWADGDWLPGALVALQTFQHEGLRVCVLSARAGFDEGAAQIVRELELAGLQGVELAVKPDAIAYVDNLGVAFAGDWYRTIADVLERAGQRKAVG